MTGANAGTLNTSTVFSGITNLGGGTGADTLTGLATANSFAITGANAVTTSGMNATSMDAVVGGAGNDTVSGTGVSYNFHAYTTKDKFTAQSITFTSIENVNDAGAAVVDMSTSPATGGLSGNLTTVGGTVFLGSGTNVGGNVNMGTGHGGTLNMGTAGLVTGTVTTDTLSYNNYLSGVTFGLAGSTTGTGGWTGVATVVGSAGNDTVTGSGATYNGFNATTKGTFSAGGKALSGFENINDAGAATVSMTAATTGGVSGNVTTVGGTMTLGGGTNVGGNVNMNGAGTLNLGTAGMVTGSVNTATLDFSSLTAAATYDIANGAGTTSGIGGTHTGVTTVTGNAANVATNLIKGGATYTLDAATANAGGDGTIIWTNFGALNAGTSVILGGAGSVAGNLTAPTLDYSTRTAAATYDIANGAGQTSGIGGTHTGVTTVTGKAGNAATNLIKGGATYTLNATTANAGSDGTIAWTNFGALNGNTVNFGTGGSVTGNVLAATLNESTDAANLAVSLTGAGAGTATNIGGSFSGVSAINANAAKSNTMGGTGLTYTLDATTADKGSSQGVTWTAFKNISDTTGTVNFQTGGSVTGNVLAATLNESTDASTLVISLTGPNAGTATNIGGSFSGVSAINANAAKSNTVGGTGLTYLLDATTADKGSSQGLTWTAIKNVSDTTGTVNFNTGGSVTGNVLAATLNESTDAANLAVTLTGTNAGTATNIGGSFSGVSAINANAAKSNTMGGTGLTYTLDATTADKASSNGVTWTAFKNLSDATGTVNFSTGGSVTGNVLATTLNESAYNADLAVTLTGTGLGTATNIGGSFSGVSAINANAAKSNTMGGTGLTYTLDATTADKGSSQGVTWTAFKNLTDTGASTFIGGANAQISGALTANSGATLNGQIKAASASFGAVTLGSDVNLTTTGNAAFNSTIDGAYALSLNAGSTTLGGVIGGSNVLTGLTINTGGDLTLKPIHALMADLTAAGDILKGDAAGTPELYVRDSLKLNATNVGATTNLVLANLNIAGGIELGLVPTSTTLTVAPAGHAIFVVPDQPTFTALRASTSGKLYGGATNAQQALGCYTGNCSSLVDGSAQSLGGTTGAVILAAAQQEMLMSLSSTDNLGAAIYNAWVTTIGVVPPGLDNIVGDGVNSQMEMLQTLPLPQSLLYVPQPQSLLYVPQQQSPLYD